MLCLTDEGPAGRLTQDGQHALPVVGCVGKLVEKANRSLIYRREPLGYFAELIIEDPVNMGYV